MRRHWQAVTRPVLDAVAPKVVVEVGCAAGENTAHLSHWCEAHGAKLHVITVVRHHEVWHLETDPPVPTMLDKREVVDVEGEHRLDAERELRAEVKKLVGDVQVEAVALVGDPADVIADFSKGVDLLVCGSRGYGPARAVLLGSVSRRVTAEAHCPVIVLPRGVKASIEMLVGDAAPVSTSQ